MKRRGLVLLMLIINLLTLNAQVGINTTTPDSNSILDIVSADEGILIPRIVLNDLNNASPLTLPVTESMLVYSKGGNINDGYYYWKNNKWNPIGRIPKKIYTVNSSGGNGILPHPIPGDADKFETYDANWASQFVLPNAITSNNNNRLNEIITIQKRSLFSFTISNLNTDMTANLQLVNSQTAVFMFDGTKWIHIKTSN